MSHACHRFEKCYKTLTFCSLLTRRTIPCACRAKRHRTSKSAPKPQFFALLTSKFASRHNGVHFFDISTSKSGPSTVCFVHFDFEMCFALPKVARTWCVLCILTSKCASRNNGVHFFNISTSKSSATMWCFVHFNFEMCFASQRLAIFHLSSGQMAPHPPL